MFSAASESSSSGCRSCKFWTASSGEAKPACLHCTRNNLRGGFGRSRQRMRLHWRPVKNPSHLAESLLPRSHRSANTKRPDTLQSASNHQALTTSKVVTEDRLVSNGVVQHNSLMLQQDRSCELPSPRTANLHYWHLDTLAKLHLQRRLMEYWVTHMSDALAPIPGNNNPFKTIFVPIAYVGAQTPAHESTASVALFHLICAAAAFHLSSYAKIAEDPSDFMTLAFDHHSQGLHHLQRNLEKYDTDQKEAVISSLLLCIYYEPVTASARLWCTHFRGALSWLQKSNATNFNQSDSFRILHQMLAATIIFLRSQIEPSEALQQYGASQDIITNAEPYTLYETVGVSRQTLRFVNTVIEYVLQQRHTPCDTILDAGLIPAQLDRMELELYLAMPPTHLQTSGHSLPYHYSHIFYYAFLIYFKRMLRNVPLQEIQSLVDLSLNHIESLLPCTSRPFSPFVWPIAVTCFEAKEHALQQRVMNWLDLIIERSTLSIWRRAKPLFSALWTERTVSGNANIRWDDFLSDHSASSIMLV